MKMYFLLKMGIFQSAMLVYQRVYGCFQKQWYPQIIHFNRVFHYKPSILGCPFFWKHTCWFTRGYLSPSIPPPLPFSLPVAMVPLNLAFTVLVEGISDKYGKVENSLDGLDWSKTFHKKMEVSRWEKNEAKILCCFFLWLFVKWV